MVGAGGLTIKDICRDCNARIDSRLGTNFFCSRCYVHLCAACYEQHIEKEHRETTTVLCQNCGAPMFVRSLRAQACPNCGDTLRGI